MDELSTSAGRSSAAGSRMEILGDGPRLQLVGDLDGRSTYWVRDAVDAAVAAYERVVVDLSEVDNADLTGLRVLAVASWRATHAGRHLLVAGPRPGVRRLMHVSHLARLLEVERLDVPA
ncbi:STAS domain-containing protein [Nocardioides zeae]|uniref:STAS domain-containing protein n=1 Tax=Nocardioides imazamoxiresistens TaxID=3231893 RepID=A0ABU3Q0S0_9ACTN|nr:STAS domain-containing protein [Nocardioides zeae]MDT9595117.1 STAS domain-containing protein [Nocardioides zeae]